MQRRSISLPLLLTFAVVAAAQEEQQSRSLSQAHDLLTKTANFLQRAQRAEGVQQQGGGIFAPATNAPQCNNGTYATVVRDAFSKCGNAMALWPLFKPSASESVSNKRWSDFCATDCVKVVSKDLAGTPLEDCMDPFIRSFAVSNRYLCEAEAWGGIEPCDVSVSRLLRFASCSGFNSTQCAEATDVCESYTKKGEGSFPLIRVPVTHGVRNSTACRPKATRDIVGASCDGGCREGLLSRLDFQGNTTNLIRDSLRTLSELVCFTASSDNGGGFCLPLIRDPLDELDAGTATAKTLEAVCHTKSKLDCFQKMRNITAKFGLEMAQHKLTQCAAEQENSAALINTECVPAFRNATAQVRELEQQVEAMCTKNKHSAYCLPYLDSVQKNQCYVQALHSKHHKAAVSHKNCTKTHPHCAKSLSQLAHHMGCCVGTLQSAMYKTNFLAPSDFPSDLAQDVWGPQGPPADSYYQTPYDGYLASMADCGATNVKLLLQERCTTHSGSEGGVSQVDRPEKVGKEIFVFLAVVCVIVLIAVAALYNKWNQRHKEAKRARLAMADLDTPPESPKDAAQTGTYEADVDKREVHSDAGFDSTTVSSAPAGTGTHEDGDVSEVEPPNGIQNA